MPIDSPWMTTLEAAKYARCHPHTINKALRSRHLAGSQAVTKGRWLIHRDALDAWIAKAAA
jgi:excisionase family DNA binding protein